MSREYGGARKYKCSSRKDVKSQSPISTNLKSEKKKHIKIKIRISMSVYKAEFYVVIIMSLYVVTLIQDAKLIERSAHYTCPLTFIHTVS